MVFLDRLFCVIFDNFLDEDNFYSFKGRKNGKFLYLFFPFLFKNYHFEKNLNLLFDIIQERFKSLLPCYNYLLSLYKEILERITKELNEEKGKEEEEFSEEKAVLMMFLWSIVKNKGKKENEMKCICDLSVKVFGCLGRIDEEKGEKGEGGEEKEEGKKEGKEKEKESEEDEKEKDIVKVKDKVIDGLKEGKNRKEIVIIILMKTLETSFRRYLYREKEYIKKDGRIVKILLEIVNSHSNKDLLFMKEIKRE